MQDQAFSTLEVDRLRTLISRGAKTPMGRARLQALVLFEQLNTALALSLVREPSTCTTCGRSLVVSEVPDPSPASFFVTN